MELPNQVCSWSSLCHGLCILLCKKRTFWARIYRPSKGLTESGYWWWINWVIHYLHVCKEFILSNGRTGRGRGQWCGSSCSKTKGQWKHRTCHSLVTFRQRHYVLCWERRFHTWSSYQCRCKRWEWRISDEPHYIKTCVDIRTCSSATSIRWRPSSASGINSSLFTCPKESTTVQILTVCMPFTCDISTKALCLMLRKTPLILEAVSYQCRCRRWEWRISDWPHYIKTCVNISTNSLATSIRWWPSSASIIYSTLFTCLRESSTGQILTVCIWYLPKLQWQWELISMMDPRHVYFNMFNGFCSILNKAQIEDGDNPMWQYGCSQ